MTIHPGLERSMSRSGLPGRLRIVLMDERAAGRASDVVEGVVGQYPALTDPVSLSVDVADGRTAVDVLAELAWASVVPIAFSLD